MVIAIGSDHAGFELKEHVKERLREAGHELVDVGAHSSSPVDYPDFALAAAELVASGQAERGVLACGSGNGVAIVANKVSGIRAANAHDAAESEMARRHNDINVVTLSGQRLSADGADSVIFAFLSTSFDGGRHAGRVDKICAIDHSLDSSPAD